MSIGAAPGWDRGHVVAAVVRDDGSGEVVIGGNSYPIYMTTLSQARTEVMRRVVEHAIALGRPVAVTAQGPEGTSELVVHPDGSVRQGETPPEPAAPASSATPSSYAAPPSYATPSSAAPSSAAQQGHGDVPYQEPAYAGPAQAFPQHSLQARGAPDFPFPPMPDRATLRPQAPPPAAGQGTTTDAAHPEAPPRSSPFPSRAAARRRSAAPPAIPVEGPGRPPARPTENSGRPPAAPAEMPGHPLAPYPPDSDRRSFLVEERGEDPARRGVRGALARIGMHMPPSAEERAERADEAAVSQHWPGPRTVAVVNGKGGAGKTPGTVLLSSVFAAHGGSGVVAWDNNQTRGTLGWRTQQGPHDATLHDLLPQIEHFLGPSAQLADLAWYVHHQPQMRFDVLRSKPMVLADEQRISSGDVDAIHAVLSKYYRLIFIDSGNDESDPMWLRMIDHTDQIVVATTTRDDHAEAGALLLEALAARDPRSAELARGAVVLVSQADPKATPPELQQVVRGYRNLAREVVTVPFDPGMVDGQLSLRRLRPATQRAWLAAGAAIARGF
ncbi:ATPase [Myceligenerans crystallogenes]|uniref:Chromosome partitioning protein n=1 Tax=Myceligenerans crystallogenes TaxID=316335 RepID=A0ABP4ZXG0_9MICO